MYGEPGPQQKVRIRDAGRWIEAPSDLPVSSWQTGLCDPCKGGGNDGASPPPYEKLTGSAACLTACFPCKKMALNVAHSFIWEGVPMAVPGYTAPSDPMDSVSTLCCMFTYWTMCGCIGCPVMYCSNRQHRRAIRRNHNIVVENECVDCLSACCCCLGCSVVQHHNEMLYREATRARTPLEQKMVDINVVSGTGSSSPMSVR